jgi:2-dehydro-3-deoxyphosphogluconate aldolase/(4S)-4-hydroxy-2-oxoglutarate aldolase
LIKALLGPYPELLLIPTGGVNGSNVADYLAAGAVAVGVGEWLTGHDDLEIVSERSAELRRQVV